MDFLSFLIMITFGLALFGLGVKAGCDFTRARQTEQAPPPLTIASQDDPSELSEWEAIATELNKIAAYLPSMKEPPPASEASTASGVSTTSDDQPLAQDPDYLAKPSYHEFIANLREQIDQQVSLEEVLDLVYLHLREYVAFERMGYAQINYERDLVSAKWHRSDRPAQLATGYSAPLSTSSLQFVAEQNRSRVLSNLPEYLEHHPNSESTRRLVEEGFGSSLTCPVAYQGKVIAFLFITSVATNHFNSEQVPMAEDVAALLGRAEQLFHEKVAV